MERNDQPPQSPASNPKTPDDADVGVPAAWLHDAKPATATYVPAGGKDGSSATTPAQTGGPNSGIGSGSGTGSGSGSGSSGNDGSGGDSGVDGSGGDGSGGDANSNASDSRPRDHPRNAQPHRSQRVVGVEPEPGSNLFVAGLAPTV
eukprot:CAMPEP_0174850564 /NCGR_PEP_ID=MMETSP1114-20130205/20030_1 /TAXON_ID=312471 /ORGANISM="Neobodo designis, Strain CCAP 1951/1" /LENGTH=146 /DNA_ID=CAMNT_0016085031 /DNA_START=504 /DNA_END=941 /DNA_ORIENTATION=-